MPGIVKNLRAHSIIGILWRGSLNLKKLPFPLEEDRVSRVDKLEEKFAMLFTQS
jgi:hypothetical protein